ncbi:hypothetical protein FB451DRAFT_1234089 [Mycena latifolia]|nr:hypothetical protein FB451DRAFT_1234089 [Mycena latifolia]
MHTPGVKTMWLPPEIWLHVFLLATSVSYTPQLYEIHYHPFHNPPNERERSMLRIADKTMLALGLVCREWHIWSQQFLLETVRLSWYGSQKLVESLQRSSSGGFRCGEWTRRLELSVIEHENADHPISPADILRACPNVEVLVKADDDLLPHSVAGVNLTSLKRFDWYYARYRDGNHQFATEDDDLSRGQDFLRDVVKHAPNLEYLSLGKRFRSAPRFGPSPSALMLPALVTLRLRSISQDVWKEIETWAFPRLRVLLVDATFLDLPRSPRRTWDAVEVLELLQDHSSIFTASIIPSILKICPNAQELNYCVEYVHPPPPDSVVRSVRVVRLDFAINPDFRFGPVEEDNRAWRHISAHFLMLAGPVFPSLQRVVLSGPWQRILKDRRIELFQKKLVKRGCKLEDSSGGALR